MTKYQSRQFGKRAFADQPMTRAKSRTIAKVLNKNLSLLQAMYANNHELDITDNDEVALETVSAEALKEIETMILESVDDTELKDVYSKADTTEQALPQLKVNYKSQIRANLLKRLK